LENNDPLFSLIYNPILDSDVKQLCKNDISLLQVNCRSLKKITQNLIDLRKIVLEDC